MTIYQRNRSSLQQRLGMTLKDVFHHQFPLTSNMNKVLEDLGIFLCLPNSTTYLLEEDRNREIHDLLFRDDAQSIYGSLVKDFFLNKTVIYCG